MPVLKRSFISPKVLTSLGKGTGGGKKKNSPTATDQSDISPSENNPPSAVNNSDVWVIRHTGEIFTSYEDYLERIHLYKQRAWTCRLTGHTGLTFFEALESELAARQALEGYEEVLKKPTTESIDALSSHIFTYLKNTLFPGEQVKVLINDDWYDGKIQLMEPAPVFSADGCTLVKPGSCKVVLLSGEDKIGEASISDLSQTERKITIPSKHLIKKFIRASAARFGQAGMPWLVHDSIVQHYEIRKEPIDKDLAEKVAASLVYRTREKERKSHGSGSIQSIEPLSRKGSKQSLLASAISLKDADHRKVQSQLIKYPIFEEFLPAEKQTSASLRPLPKQFDPTLSIVKENMISQALDLWQFLHSFRLVLGITPMSLADLISSLEYDKAENPIVETLFCQFLSLLRESAGKGKPISGYFEEFLQQVQSASIVPMLSVFNEDRSATKVSDNESEEDDDAVVGRKRPHHGVRKSSAPSKNLWHKTVTETLETEAYMIPVVLKILEVMKSKGIPIFALDGAAKLVLLMVLRDVYLVAYEIDEFVNKEIEEAADARQEVRENDLKARKLQKTVDDLEGTLEELRQQQNDGNTSLLQQKEISRIIKSTEAELRSTQKEINDAQKIVTKMSKELRKHSAVRVNCLGSDRDERRYWWFDEGRLDDSHKVACLGGIILVEDFKNSPSWGLYDSMEEVEELLKFLNPLGSREGKLIKAIESCIEQLKSTLCSFPLTLAPLLPEKSTNLDIFDSESNQLEEPLKSQDKDEDDDEEDLPVVSSQRKRRKSSKTNSGRPFTTSAPQLPSFLRYHNTS